MNCPRHLNIIARLMLAWLMVSMGVATASPFVQPKTMQVICSQAGHFTMVALGDDTVVSSAHASLDCPTCLAVSPPATSSPPKCAQPQLCGYALPHYESWHTPRLVGAQMPARGPPPAPLA
ncbi:hypothetical protein C8D04_0838 [Simplicispira sp. 125]|nr:hypothetical protein C8D04_0838 [Simplicispira sp. 125]REG16576.1 hypothetical protein C8D01_1147 [Simplicispira sp. 110]